jgi:predicted DNA-binding transcriptional regulator AlpA
MSDTKVKPVRAQSRLKSQSTLNREIKSMEVSSEAAAAVYINHQEKTRQKVNDKIQERLKKKQAAMAQKQIEKVYGDDKEIISETESTDADVENALSANILIVKKQKNPNRKSQPSAVAVVPTPVPIQAPAKQGNEVKSCCSKMLAILMWLFVGLLCSAGIIALIILILRLSPLPGGADDGENPIGNGNNTSPVHITTTTTAPPTPPTPPTTTPPPPPPTTTTTTTTTATPTRQCLPVPSTTDSMVSELSDWLCTKTTGLSDSQIYNITLETQAHVTQSVFPSNAHLAGRGMQVVQGAVRAFDILIPISTSGKNDLRAHVAGSVVASVMHSFGKRATLLNWVSTSNAADEAKKLGKWLSEYHTKRETADGDVTGIHDVYFAVVKECVHSMGLVKWPSMITKISLVVTEFSNGFVNGFMLSSIGATNNNNIWTLSYLSQCLRSIYKGAALGTEGIVFPSSSTISSVHGNIIFDMLTASSSFYINMPNLGSRRIFTSSTADLSSLLSFASSGYVAGITSSKYMMGKGVGSTPSWTIMNLKNSIYSISESIVLSSSSLIKPSYFTVTNISAFHSEVSFQVMFMISQSAFSSTLVPDVKSIGDIFVSCSHGFISGITSPKFVSNVGLNDWTKLTLQNSVKLLMKGCGRALRISYRSQAPLVTSLEIKEFFQMVVHNLLKKSLAGFTKVERPMFVGSQNVQESLTVIIQGLVSGCEGTHTLAATIMTYTIESIIVLVGRSSDYDLIAKPSILMTATLNACVQGILSFQTQITNTEMFAAIQEMLHSVSHGVGLWPTQYITEYGETSFYDVVTNYVKVTMQHIILQHPTISSTNIVELYSSSMQGNLMGMKHFKNVNAGQFKSVFKSTNKAWSSSLRFVPQLLDGTVLNPILTMRTKIDEVVVDSINTIKIFVTSITQSDLLIFAKEGIRESITVLRSAFSASDLDAWLTNVCTSRRSGAKCGDFVKDCGEECDAQDDDTCYNCRTISTCPSNSNCNSAGTIGNFVAEQPVSNEGVSTISTPPFQSPHAQPIDLVYSPSLLFALVLEFDASTSKYSLWKVGVTSNLAWTTETPTLMFSSATALTGVRIVDDGINDAWVILVDMGACVLRKVKMVAPFTETIFAGAVSQCSFVDASGSAARFNHPTSIDLWPGATRALITDRDNNCVRLVHLQSALVEQFSGTCARAHTNEHVIHYTPTSVVYLQPQKVIINPSMDFALVYSYTSYSSVLNPSLAGFRDHQAQIYQVWLINGALSNGWTIVPGSATSLLDSKSYSRTTDPNIPHMGMTFDAAGLNLYFILSRVEPDESTYAKYDETSYPQFRQTRLYKLTLSATTDQISILSTISQSKHVSLCMSPGANTLTASDYDGKKMLKFILSRPPGRFGSIKKCFTSSQTCACLPGFTGYKCDGESDM